MAVNVSEFGILIYDIPQNNSRLYYQLRSKISRRAIRMNLSVWLFPWGQKADLDGVIAEAKKATGQSATVAILKFDNSDQAEIERIARESLLRETHDLGKRLMERVAVAEEKCKEVSDRYVKEVERRLQAAEGLVVLFGLTHDISVAIEAVRESVRAEVQAHRSKVGKAVNA